MIGHSIQTRAWPAKITALRWLECMGAVDVDQLVDTEGSQSSAAFKITRRECEAETSMSNSCD
jgi:hypothetical protein